MSAQRLSDRRMLHSINIMFDYSSLAHVILVHRQCITKFLDQATQLLFICRRKAIIRSTNQFTDTLLLPLVFRRRCNRLHDIHPLSSAAVAPLFNRTATSRSFILRSWRNQRPRCLHTFPGYLSSLAHPRLLTIYPGRTISWVDHHDPNVHLTTSWKSYRFLQY